MSINSSDLPIQNALQGADTMLLTGNCGSDAEGQWLTGMAFGVLHALPEELRIAALDAFHQFTAPADRVELFDVLHDWEISRDQSAEMGAIADDHELKQALDSMLLRGALRAVEDSQQKTELLQALKCWLEELDQPPWGNEAVIEFVRSWPGHHTG